MSNVEFENDFNPGQAPSQSFASSVQNAYQPQSGRGMAGWLVRKGIIQEESQAKGILLGVVVLNIILTVFVIYYFIF